MASNYNRRQGQPGSHSRSSGPAVGSSRRTAQDRSQTQGRRPGGSENGSASRPASGSGRGSGRGGSARGGDGMGGKRKSSPLKKIVVAVVSAAAALAVAYAVLSHTSVFEITAVETEGTTRLTNSYLNSVVSVPKGANLLNVDAGSIADRITENPWVASVNVKRSFPHTLVLQINENLPAAVVELQPTGGETEMQYWLISPDCRWMGQVTPEGVQQARQLVIDSTGDAGDQEGQPAGDAGDGSQTPSGDGSQPADSTADPSSDGSGDASADGSGEASQSQADPSICSDVYYTATELSKIPIITDVSDQVAPAVGAEETDSGIVSALAIVENSKGDFGNQIATITSASGSSTGVVLKNGVEVSFGEATEMDSKIAIAQDLLQQHEGQISYINVRVPSRPSWRGIS